MLPLSPQVLYIIGIALHEQIDALKTGDKSFRFLQHSMGDKGLLRQLESLVNNTNINQEPIKDLLAWVLRVRSFRWRGEGVQGEGGGSCVLLTEFF